jgi:hypothetical protein
MMLFDSEMFVVFSPSGLSSRRAGTSGCPR